MNATGPGNPELATINARVVRMDENPPPNPVADDRNDSSSRVSVPSRPHKDQRKLGRMDAPLEGKLGMACELGMAGKLGVAFQHGVGNKPL